MNINTTNSSFAAISENNSTTKPKPFLGWPAMKSFKDVINWTQLTNRHFYIMLLADAVLIALAYTFAYLIRFEFNVSRLPTNQILSWLPFVLGSKLIIFFSFGLYRGMWRYTSTADLWQLFKVVSMTAVLMFFSIPYLSQFSGYSHMVLILDGLLTFLLTGGLRFMIRNYFSANSPRSLADFLSYPVKNRPIRTLIVGAGNAGEYVLREINKTARPNYHILGLVDNDINKKGRSIHGRKVICSMVELPAIVKRNNVDMILIAIPSASAEELRSIVQTCERIGVTYRTLPSLNEMIDGKISVSDFRKINYQDLLGRDPVQLNREEISDYLSDRTVLVTGAGGSIGSELCRQIIRFEPSQLILVDASEENLFKIQAELNHESDYRTHQIILARVQNRPLMERVFDQYRPEVVFHAAANKHVPIMEVNPWEAVYNNIRASLTAMELAVKYKSKRFVLVSTDKAVHPANVMGASKRVTELLLQSFQGNNTLFMAVRFGNVIGSSGSVIPLFERQLKNGGPLTVTHPEITRYFMTIPEASQLILQAGSMGRGGEIFILDMGQPVRIANLAKDLIRLGGKEPGKDIEIVYTGLREGEKLHEELKMQNEDLLPTSHGKILVLKANGTIYGFEYPQDLRNWLYKKIDELNGAALTMNSVAIKRKLKEIVSEYSPQKTSCVLSS